MNTILPQSFGNVLVNLIKSHLNFSFDNYISLMSGVDKAFNKAIVATIVTIFEKIDTDYRNSSIRKASYHIKCYASRTLVTVFGEITFKRTYYTYKHDKSCFCYLDRFLGLPKKDIYDPYIKSVIVDFATSHSAPKTTEIVSELIGCKLKFKDFKDKVHISRQMVRNIINKIPKLSVKTKVLSSPDTLYIMADEKWVGRQNNDGKKTEVKLAVCYDKSCKISPTRRVLDNKHYVSSVTGSMNIWNQMLDYVYMTYDTDNIKKVVLMGDGANWIKNGLQWFKFNKDTITVFALDHFHFKQAVMHISKDTVVNSFLLRYIYTNKPHFFRKLLDVLISRFPHRKSTLENKRDYIINNWISIQRMIDNYDYRCSMEGHISHVLADLFDSRPKGYSIKTLSRLLNLRILKKNGYDLRLIYLNTFNNPDDEIVLMNDDILNFDCVFRSSSNSNIPIIENGNIHIFPAKALLNISNSCKL